MGFHSELFIHKVALKRLYVDVYLTTSSRLLFLNMPVEARTDI
jgi:hypothetical protein